MPADHPSIAPDHRGHRDRLRERHRLAGIVGWPDYEVVELLLTNALPRRDVKPIAKRLVTRFGNLRGILDADPESLEGVPGIGANASSFLTLIHATALRYLQQNAEGIDLQSPEHLRLFWQSRLRSLPYEVVEVAFLDGATRLLPDGVRRLAEGTTESATVEPRRILEDALRRKAAAIVLAHNRTDRPDMALHPRQPGRLRTNPSEGTGRIDRKTRSDALTSLKSLRIGNCHHKGQRNTRL